MEYAVRSTEYPFLTSTPSAGVLVIAPAIRLHMSNPNILHTSHTAMTDDKVITAPKITHFMLMLEFSLAPAITPLPTKNNIRPRLRYIGKERSTLQPICNLRIMQPTAIPHIRVAPVVPNEYPKSESFPIISPIKAHSPTV